MAPSVLITGASQGGIGDYLAQDFLKRGFKVFATARDLSKVEHLKELGITIVKLDVTSLESVKAAAKEVEASSGGRLDVLVNNSGAGTCIPHLPTHRFYVVSAADICFLCLSTAYSMPVLDTDIHVAKDMFEVNYFGVLRVTQEFSALVIAARGKILNISSIVGEFPNSFTSKSRDYPLIPGSRTRS